jgi:hypothetical protein
MTLLEEIQNEAVDGSSDLATVLRKCRVLSAKLIPFDATGVDCVDMQIGYLLLDRFSLLCVCDSPPICCRKKNLE